MPFLEPNFAEANMIRWGYKPLEPYTKASAKWKCIHIECGEIVHPIYADLNRGRGGCASCASTKVNPKIAICILVENAGYGGTISAPIAQRLLTKFFFPHQKDSTEIKSPVITSAVPEKKIAKNIAKTNKTLAVNPR